MDSNPSVLKMFFKQEEHLSRLFLICSIHLNGTKKFSKERLFENIRIWPETSIRNERIIVKHNSNPRKMLIKAIKSIDWMN